MIQDLINEYRQLVADNTAKDAEIATLKQQVAALAPPQPFVWDQLNRSSFWLQPANVGDTGGGNVLKPGIGVLTSGDPMTYRFTPGHQWNNAYVYLELEKLTVNGGFLQQQFGKLSSFKFNLDLSLPQESQVWQALEFELQYAHAGWVYNMAWQLLPSGVLRAFQFTTKQWMDTGLRCGTTELDDLNTGKVLSFIAEFHVNQAFMSETHTRITVNGTVLNPNFSQPAQSGGGEYLHCAFQLDTNAAMNAYTLGVGNVRVEAS